MPNTLLSTAGMTHFLSHAVSISSSERAMRTRGPSLSAGTSLSPSGAQKLTRQGLPNALPSSAAISSERLPCSTQNLRTLSSGDDSVSPFFIFGCAKNVGLKSMPSSPRRFANATHGSKYL